MKLKPKCARTIIAPRNLITAALPKCSVTQTGTTFDESITFEEWAALGKQVLRLAEAIQWTIGDWLNFGYRKFIASLEGNSKGRLEKQKYKLALQALPYDYQSLANMAWISDSVLISRRRENLSFAHHGEVAALQPGDQIKFLNLAEKKGWSRSELRAAIRKEDADPSADDSGEVMPGQCFTQWTTRAQMMLARENPDSWSKERREATKRALQWLVDFYNRL